MLTEACRNPAFAQLPQSDGQAMQRLLAGVRRKGQVQNRIDQFPIPR
jgi:hypothetical protein